MSSPSMPVEHPALSLRQELEKSMTQSDVKEQYFISKKSIEKFWPDDLGVLKAKLGLHSWGAPDVELLPLLDRTCRTIICILAWTRYEPFDQKLKEIGLDLSKEKEGEAEVDLKDSRLILDEDVCIKHLGFQPGRLFYQDQFIFCPVLISSTEKGIQELNLSRRWPYKSPPIEIGFGAFGSVSKVLVVKGQYQDTAGHSNDEDKPVAFKSVNKSADWRKEVKTLDFLKESLSKHERLTLHIAAFIQGNKFYIFMPYTPYGDLENFLQEGAQHDEGDGQLYDFAKTFANFNILDLAREFALVIDATAYLHDRVSSARGIAVFCAHADLRPTNILIFPGDQDHPAGIWRISDFGISSVKLEDDQKLPEPVWAREPTHAKDHPSMGDIIEGRWSPSGSRSTVHKLYGTHVAPERSISKIYTPRESDVWSLGCIFLEVLVFGLGTQQEGNRKKELDAFRTARTSFKGADRDDYFFDLDSVSVPEDSSRKVTVVRRPKVDEWLRYFHNEKGLLCRELAIIVHKMLQPNPEARCRAKIAYEAVLKACNNHVKESMPPPKEQTPASGEGEDQSLVAAAWMFIADSDASTNLVFRNIETQPSREDSTVLASAGSHRGHPFEPQSPVTPRPFDTTDLQRFQRTQTFLARKGSVNIWTSDSDSLPNGPAVDVQSLFSRRVVVYLCQGAERHDPTGSSPARRRHAYELRFRQLERNDSGFTARPSYSLPLNIDWRELHMDGRYATVNGREFGSNVAAVHVYDMANQSEVSLPLDLDKQRMRKLIASARGAFVAYDRKQLTVWRSGSSSGASKIASPLSAHGRVVFDRTGTRLFTWSCKHGEDTIHVLAVLAEVGPSTFATYLVPRPMRRAPLRLLLVPCGTLPACILRTGSGIWFTASARPDHPYDNAPVRALEQRDPGPDIPNDNVLCVANEHHFFYVSSRSEVRMCDLIWTDDTTLNLQPKREPLHKMSIRNAKSIELHLRRSGAYKLVVCNYEGAIESIEIVGRD